MTHPRQLVVTADCSLQAGLFAGLAVLTGGFHKVRELAIALFSEELFKGPRGHGIGAQDSFVSLQSALHTGSVLGHTVVFLLGMLNEKDHIAENDLPHHFGFVSVPRLYEVLA